MLDCELENRRMIKIFRASIMAAKNKPNKGKVKCIVPGRETIRTPANPINTADHLRIPTFSFRTK